jgi:leucyl aminopeptidase
MSLTVSTTAPRDAKHDALVLLLNKDRWKEQLTSQLGDWSAAVAELAQAEGFDAKTGQLFSTPTFGNISSRRLLLLGTGSEALDSDAIKDLGGQSSKAATKVRAASMAMWADWDDAALGSDPSAAASLLGQGMALGAYRFDRYMTEKEGESKQVRPTSFEVLAGEHIGALDSIGSHTTALIEGIVVARNLGNEPPQVCTPSYMAKEAARIARDYGMETKTLDTEALNEKGMNLLAAVGRGSVDGPQFVHIVYKGAGEIKRKMAFVGKGVTFDTGGYSLKISGSMLGMHLDMCGGAAVLGAAESIGRLKPEGVEIHFIVAAASNMVSKDAYTVNEIILGYGGKTVEIANTDAEGRLCLADALAFASELDVDEVIDLATLTGACVVALGEQYSALFSNNQHMATDLLSSSREAGERIWHMPLDAKLRDKLKSPVADMKNIGDRWGGCITAALFLKEWVGDKRWAHLDIAGPASLENDSPIGHKGASGVGVSTLVAYATRVG